MILEGCTLIEGIEVINGLKKGAFIYIETCFPLTRKPVKLLVCLILEWFSFVTDFKGFDGSEDIEGTDERP